MARYRKESVEVEARQFTGTNQAEIVAFMERQRPLFVSEGIKCIGVDIQTLEGIMRTNTGDYIIKGVNGEFYPCKPEIFEKTYEKVT